MKQHSVRNWPVSLNDTVGMLRLEPVDIESRSNLLFESSHDSLDYFKGCFVELENGEMFGLVRYANNPVAGTEIVMAQGGYDPSGGPEQFKSILAAIGASLDDVFWRRTVDITG